MSMHASQPHPLTCSASGNARPDVTLLGHTSFTRIQLSWTSTAGRSSGVTTSAGGHTPPPPPPSPPGYRLLLLLLLPSSPRETACLLLQWSCNLPRLLLLLLVLVSAVGTRCSRKQRMLPWPRGEGHGGS
jgi:hypothetical protein